MPDLIRPDDVPVSESSDAEPKARSAAGTVIDIVADIAEAILDVVLDIDI